MNISTDTLLELKCCECECYLSRTPIYVGEDGTAICGRCPIPKAEDSKISTYFRMIPYENLMKEIPFPCMYQNNGCTVKMISKYLQPHEDNCNYRPHICPMMPSKGCNWIGRNEKLIEHVENQHADCLLENPCIFRHDYTKNSLQTYVTVIFNTLFLINAKVCLSTNKIYHSVYCYGNLINNFKLVVERECDQIIKNGKIVPISQKKTEENIFVSCSIRSLIEILNGSDKTTFTIHIEPTNTCIWCSSFSETLNENGFCELCNSMRVKCKLCAFKDIDVKVRMHSTNFCKFTKWCWICNTHLNNFLYPHHYDENHKDVIYLEHSYWNISKDDFKIVNLNRFIDFIIDSKYGRFFGLLVDLRENFFLKVCSGTLQSEEASKLVCRVSIQNNSDIKYYHLNYNFESRYDWNFHLPKNCLFSNNNSSQIKIDFLKKV